MNALRSGNLIALTMAVAVLLTASTAWGGDRCQPFTGTIVARLVPLSPGVFIWKGEISISIGGGPTLHGTTETINTGVKKGGPGTTEPVYIGTEETTVVLDNQAGSFMLMTRFVAPQHGFDATGVAWVNERGTIAPVPKDESMFKNAYGHFTLRGPFGPAVPHLPDGILGWNGEYHGNICGIN